MLEIGITGKQTEVVTPEKTAAALGSGFLEVYATPAMVALMEKTALRSVADHLDEGMSTVGISLNIAHSSASPLGCTITCESKLVEIDRRRLVFEVVARDDFGEIGRGTHERFVVDAKRFLEKAAQKKVNF